ncbi:chromatin accessibility complex protein 1-like [Limulus polyphemus]|uniref:Chromatin accessibility complex protein 1-like n=1 Tax=Limulus polyphemus TaxID=6850 RepID=A0ABM1B896_LIMPO|nr:chromatin accessibility complex protein 1-like [Limulus polyphemus]
MEKLSKSSKHVSFPLTRIKMIMRSSPDVLNISPDSVTLISKAAELLVEHLAKLAHHQSKDKTKVDYEDVAEVVASHESLDFLQDIVPQKIKASEYLNILKQVEEEEKKLEVDL